MSVASAMLQVELLRDQLASELTPSRELSLALTKLDEARLWLGEAPA
ncbi:hypothetical protein N1031_07025 [Herbiconiux moechotypicola]|nr:hypothetical protein [Herbiconiux moechotypicola]MCS5729509.1 hypothetical protein [Herbiconiux moechotypicola]